MKLNGYGTHRVHQIEVEWTPEWESAYHQVLEKHRDIQATAEKNVRRAAAWLLVTVALAVGSLYWLDKSWVTALLILVATGTADYHGRCWWIAEKGDIEVERASARLWLLRALTHDTSEMARRAETVEKPSWDESGFDGQYLQIVRDELSGLGIKILTERFAWLPEEARGTLRDLSRHRRPLP